MGRQFWPGDNPVGRSLRVNGVVRAVVGVVQDASINGLREDPEPYLYVPYAQMPGGDSTLIIEAAVDPRNVMAEVRRVITYAEPGLPVLGMLTLKDQMASALYDQGCQRRSAEPSARSASSWRRWGCTARSRTP